MYACSKHIQYQFAIEYALNPIILYLPLNELKHLVNALIRLGFYQDHRAILALVEALFLRKHLHQTDTETLTSLQYVLLDKSIQFHSQHHHLVTSKLRELYRAITMQNEQLLGEDAEQQAQATPSRAPEYSSNTSALAPTPSRVYIPPAPSHSIATASSFLFGASSRTAAFQEESLVLPNGQPNMLAYYTSEHVHQLLEKN